MSCICDLIHGLNSLSQFNPDDEEGFSAEKGTFTVFVDVDNVSPSIHSQLISDGWYVNDDQNGYSYDLS